MKINEFYQGIYFLKTNPWPDPALGFVKPNVNFQNS
jgi:hypothetical protein